MPCALSYYLSNHTVRPVLVACLSSSFLLLTSSVRAEALPSPSLCPWPSAQGLAQVGEPSELGLNGAVVERWEGVDGAFQGGTGNKWGEGLNISGSWRVQVRKARSWRPLNAMEE